MSAILAGLKLVNAKRQSINDPVQFRRQKLVDKLTHQINLAKALKNGETYTVKRQQNVRDQESGVTSTVEVTKKVKQWWFTLNGKTCVQLRYGSKVVEFSKGKNSVEASSSTELLSVLETLKSAVEAGELDAQIGAAADAVKARFVK